MKYFKNRTKLKKLYEDNQENLISHIALRKKGLNSIEKIDFPKGENFITKLKKDIISEGYDKLKLVIFKYEDTLPWHIHNEEDLDKYIEQLEERFRNIQNNDPPFLAQELKFSKERELNLKTYSLCVSDKELEQLDQFKSMCENEELPIDPITKKLMNNRIVNNDKYGMPLLDYEFDDYKKNPDAYKKDFKYDEILNNGKRFGIFLSNYELENTRLRIKNFDEYGIPETNLTKELRQDCAINLETKGFALSDFAFDYTRELEDNLSNYGLYFDTELINYICKEY